MDEFEAQETETGRADVWVCRHCRTEVEARDEDQAREVHGLFEDHEFEPAE